MKVDWANIVGTIAILILAILTLGTPDILDGLIKRANAVDCVTKP